MKLVFIFVVLLIMGIIFYLQIDVSENHTNPLSKCPENTPEMIYVEGGVFNLGASGIYPEESPVIQIEVQSFKMSRFEVTNKQFGTFVTETGYKTVAERQLSSKDFPQISSALLKPGSAVFVPLDEETLTADSYFNWWHFIAGANWRNPFGPGSSIEGKDDYPVVHIAYEDAVSYANWKGHRLPTEAEFEYAARGGLIDKPYAEGDVFRPKGLYNANTWQGFFPFQDTAEDGFKGIAPIGCFKANGYGLHDLIGNVWEWTKSTYSPQHRVVRTEVSTNNENGNSIAKQEMAVIKGGSFLCSPGFCLRYRPAARQAQETGLGSNHIGFRTVEDVVN